MQKPKKKSDVRVIMNDYTISGKPSIEITVYTSYHHAEEIAIELVGLECSNVDVNDNIVTGRLSPLYDKDEVKQYIESLCLGQSGYQKKAKRESGAWETLARIEEKPELKANAILVKNNGCWKVFTTYKYADDVVVLLKSLHCISVTKNDCVINFTPSPLYDIDDLLAYIRYRLDKIESDHIPF